MMASLVGLAVVCVIGLFAFTFVETRRIERRFPPVGDLVETGAGAIHVVERAPDGPERGAVLLVHGASGNFADMSVALAIVSPRSGFGFSASIVRGTAGAPARRSATPPRPNVKLRYCAKRWRAAAPLRRSSSPTRSPAFSASRWR